jgi:hypothetical protein
MRDRPQLAASRRPHPGITAAPAPKERYAASAPPTSAKIGHGRTHNGGGQAPPPHHPSCAQPRPDTMHPADDVRDVIAARTITNFGMSRLTSARPRSGGARFLEGVGRVRHKIGWTLAMVAAAAVIAPVAHAASPSLTCGETITHSVRLDADLDCPTTPALTVGASGITVGLDRHSISAPSVGEDQPAIVDDGYGSLTIRNGTVMSPCCGGPAIVLQNATHVHVDSVSAYGGYPALSISGGKGDVIENSELDGQNLDLSADGADRLSLVSDQFYVSNSYTGATLTDVSHAAVIDSTMRVLSITGAGNLVLGNSGDTSMTVAGSGNSIVRNAAAAIEVSGGSSNSLIGNQVSFPGYPGRAGITVDGSATQTLVRSNTASHGAGDGIDVFDPTAHVVRNTTDDNEYFGIMAVPGVTGRRNEASGNNDLGVQCLNVACTTDMG